MEDEDDFFGEQDPSDDRAAGLRELEAVERRFRDVGLRESLASAREAALQVGFFVLCLISSDAIS